MNHYRIYVLNPQERVSEKFEDAFPSDRAALECAEDVRGGAYAAEVWDGERLVARLGGEFRIG